MFASSLILLSYDCSCLQALIAAGNWVQAVLLNAPRHRRRLRRGLEDWCHLYQHAINADCSEALMVGASRDQCNHWPPLVAHASVAGGGLQHNCSCSRYRMRWSQQAGTGSALDSTLIPSAL